MQRRFPLTDAPLNTAQAKVVTKDASGTPYSGGHVGANPHKRDAYKGHPFFDDCATFCER